MNTWAPLWSGCVDSSLWDEPDFVVKVFLTMMALKDADHIVRLTAYQIGRNSRKTEPEVLEALRILSSPDTRRLEPQEFEGRRIEKVEDGWLILNGQKYRDMVSEERRKAKNRRSQAAWRERQKAKKAGNGAPLAGEATYQKILESEGQAAADAFVDKMSGSSASNEGAKMNTEEIRRAVAAGESELAPGPSPHVHEGEQGDSPLDLPEAEVPEL